MWIFNFEKDADGKHPYTPLQALDNLTEEEIFNKEERIKYFRSCVKQVIEFYEDNKRMLTKRTGFIKRTFFIGCMEFIQWNT